MGFFITYFKGPQVGNSKLWIFISKDCFALTNSADLDEMSRFTKVRCLVFVLNNILAHQIDISVVFTRTSPWERWKNEQSYARCKRIRDVIALLI